MDMGKFNRSIAIPVLVTIFGLGAVDSVDDIQVQDMRDTSHSIQYDMDVDRRGDRFILSVHIFSQKEGQVFSSTIVEVYDIQGDLIKTIRDDLDEPVLLEVGIPFYMRFSFDDCKDCRTAKIFFMSGRQ